MGIKLIVFMKLKICSYDRMICLVPPFVFSPLYAYTNISNLTDDRGRYLYSGTKTVDKFIDVSNRFLIPVYSSQELPRKLGCRKDHLMDCISRYTWIPNLALSFNIKNNFCAVFYQLFLCVQHFPDRPLLSVARVSF